MAHVPVFFGLAESRVDQILEDLAQQGAAPVRCFVFGLDMPLLAALASHWEKQVAITIVCMPVMNTEDVRDAAMTILENEHVELAQVIWIHAGKDGRALPVEAGTSLSIDALSVNEAAADIASALTRG